MKEMPEKTVFTWVLDGVNGDEALYRNDDLVSSLYTHYFGCIANAIGGIDEPVLRCLELSSHDADLLGENGFPKSLASLLKTIDPEAKT